MTTRTVRKCPECKVPLTRHRNVFVRVGRDDHASRSGRIWRCESCGYVRIYRKTLESMVLGLADALASERQQIPLRLPGPVAALVRARATSSNRSINEQVTDYVRAGLARRTDMATRSFSGDFWEWEELEPDGEVVELILRRNGRELALTLHQQDEKWAGTLTSSDGVNFEGLLRGPDRKQEMTLSTQLEASWVDDGRLVLFGQYTGESDQRKLLLVVDPEDPMDE